MKIGDIVRPKNRQTLRCRNVIVVSADPLILVSKDSCMRWTERDPFDFIVCGQTSKELLDKLRTG